ncbi:MAG TPA: DUF4234 domain-containing protein [Thermoleophilaceae bacterium]|nr:DUF4234 domain-containing protein [Thermoleophilaceae bacterium]
MAEPIEIQGSTYTGKIRNPLAVIGLSLITFGIYGIFWYYYANKELAEIGRAHNTDELGDSPGTSVLAITLGAFVIVPALVSAYKFCKRLQTAGRLTGAGEGMEAGLLFIIYLFVSPVGAYIAQSNLNKVLQAQAGGAGSLGAGSGVTSPEIPVAPPAQQQ